jgi:HlyD family secretion protein
MKHAAWLVGIWLLALLTSWPAYAEQNIGALGRIEPKGGIIHLMGQTGETVAQILVKQGDVVRQGQPLAAFASKPLLEAELALAQLGLQEAREVQGKSLSLLENQLKVARSELDLAQKSFANMDRIGADAFSVMQVDQRKNQVQTAQVKVNSASLELERLRQESAIRLGRASEQVKLGQGKLALATLRAPGDGTILEINKGVGETCGGAPFILLADLGAMYVTADVFEADLPHLKTGQEASVSGKALGKTIKGRVESISRLISPQSKVAKVTIKLEEAEPASQLIGSEVNVSIKTTR